MAAALWVRKAAEQGHATAACHYAWMMDQGHGIDLDKGGAFNWFLKAAEGGDASAQSEVARCYGNACRGVMRDREKALFWLRKAAEQNDEVGQFNLANFYNGGGGERIDYTLAYFLYVLANRAWPELSKEQQERLRGRLAPAQIQEADDLIASWRPGMPLPTASRTGKKPILPLPPQEESPTPATTLTPIPADFDMSALDEAIRQTISRDFQSSPIVEKRVQGALLWKERLLQDPFWRPTLLGPNAAGALSALLASRYNMVFPPD